MKTLCALAMLLAPVVPGAQNGTGRLPARTALQEARPPGQEEFDRVCKVCHGPEARGDAAPRLVPFTREYQELLGIVREGVGQMPPIAARQLSDEEVARVLDYLKFLSR
jgi:mono/diheme cytochrome c family protein